MLPLKITVCTFPSATVFKAHFIVIETVSLHLSPLLNFSVQIPSHITGSLCVTLQVCDRSGGLDGNGATARDFSSHSTELP